MTIRIDDIVTAGRAGEDTLIKLAVAARDAGAQQAEVQARFEAAAASIEAEPAAYDTILDVLDRVVGWCTTERWLFRP